MNQSSKILLSMRFMLLGHGFKLRPNSHALSAASSVMTIDLSFRTDARTWADGP